MNSKRRFPEHVVSADDQEEMRRRMLEAHKFLMATFGRYQERNVPESRHNLLLAYFMKMKK